MKKIFFLFLFSSVLVFSASAQTPGPQLGVILIGPTGLSGKLWMDSYSAFDAALTGRAVENGSSIYFHLDYLYHQYDRITVDGGKMPLFWGAGVRTSAADGTDAVLGLRVPLGVSYIYGDNIFDLFFELVPFIDVLPDPLLSIDGAVGFRLFL